MDTRSLVHGAAPNLYSGASLRSLATSGGLPDRSYNIVFQALLEFYGENCLGLLIKQDSLRDNVFGG